MTAGRSFRRSSGLQSDNAVGERSRASAFPFDDEDCGNGSSSSSADCSNNDDGVIERCRQVVEYYEDECQKPAYETARWLVEQLSPEEQETAARCSYSYWYLSTQQKQPGRQAPSASARFATALREAVRHMDCADETAEILRLFRATIGFHASHETCLYRTCVSKTTANGQSVLGRERYDRIHDEMTNFQINIVRGHDRDDRAVFFAFPRRKAGTADGEQAFVDSLVYTIERTLACSEFRSVGRQDQLIVVLDTKAGSCPPVKTLQSAIGILQKHYPGRLKGCVILNAPYVLRTAWKMLKPFVHPVTYQKYIFGPSQNNPKNQAALIAELFDESQAMPVLMPGRGKLTAPVDVDRFLNEVPFHLLYDEYSPGGGTISNPVDVRKEELISPSTVESNSTLSLSSTDSSSVGRYHDAESVPTTQKKTKKKKRFGFKRRKSEKKRTFTGAAESVSVPLPPPPRSSSHVSVSVRTLAIGKLSVTASDEVDGLSHRIHW